MRMRTVDRFAFFFGIANLVMGALSLFSPFVKTRKPRGIARVLPIRTHSRGILNKQPGYLFGGMGAVAPANAMLHSALGAMGIAAGRTGNLSRTFAWLSGALFAALAAAGWASFGVKPGIHRIGPMALDWRNNILHTILGAGSLLLAARPELGQNMVQQEMHQTMSELGMGGGD